MFQVCIAHFQLFRQRVYPVDNIHQCPNTLWRKMDQICHMIERSLHRLHCTDPKIKFHKWLTSHCSTFHCIEAHLLPQILIVLHGLALNCILMRCIFNCIVIRLHYQYFILRLLEKSCHCILSAFPLLRNIVGYLLLRNFANLPYYFPDFHADLHSICFVCLFLFCFFAKKKSVVDWTIIQQSLESLLNSFSCLSCNSHILLVLPPKTQKHCKNCETALVQCLN